MKTGIDSISPDVYISSIGLIIEIKSEENKHYRARDIGIEEAKDKAMIGFIQHSKENFKYIKIYDKNYDDLLKLDLANMHN